MYFPIHVELRRSRRLTILLILVHALAAGCLWVLPWPALPRCLLLLAVAVSAWLTRRPPPVAGLRLTDNGDLLLLSAVGDALSVSIASGTVVFSQLVVLRVRKNEQRRPMTLVLLPDSMSAEQFRVLRLWLRWRAEPKGRVEGDA